MDQQYIILIIFIASAIVLLLIVTFLVKLCSDGLDCKTACKVLFCCRDNGVRTIPQHNSNSMSAAVMTIEMPKTSDGKVQSPRAIVFL